MIISIRKCLLTLAVLLSGFDFFLHVHSADAAETKQPSIQESEIRRVVRERVTVLPWRKQPQSATNPNHENSNSAASMDGPLPDLSAGDLIIKAGGDFTREEISIPNAAGKNELKEVLTLNRDVEIEQVQAQSVLRGQKIKVMRDLATNRTELLEAHGGVELVTPRERASGDSLSYSVKFSPDGREQKSLYTIEGNRTAGIKATLWAGNDAIEADKFVSDVDTFRAMGRPVAILTLPERAAAASPTPSAPGNSPGLLSGLTFAVGQKIRMQADGEMHFDVPLGRIRITRNVTLHQPGSATQAGMKISADEVLLTLATPQPGQSARGTGVFSGSLIGMECLGRMEIKAHPRTVLCDRGVLDMQRNIFTMEMKDPKADVRIFTQETAEGGKVIVAPKTISVNMDTGELTAGGAMKMESFTGSPPTNRAPR